MDYESEYDGSCGRSHHGHHGHHSHIRSHHHRGRSPSSAGRSTPGSDSSGEQAKSRMRWILSLGLLLPALAAIIGVVAWAVSAEVVMGARRESAFKLSGPASRFHQSGHRSEDDFDIDRLDLKTSDIKSRPSSSSSSVLSSSSSSSSSRNGMSKESRIIGDNSNSNSNNNEMNSQSKSSANNGLKPGQSNDRNGNVYFLAGLDALNSEARPNFQSNPSDSSKKSAGARVAEVIDRLVSQRKSEGSSPHIVVVAPLPDKSKKSGSGSSSQTTTTPKPSSTPSARSKFEEEPGAFSRDADTLLAAAHLLARHSMANKRSDDERGIFSIESNSDKPGFESANLLAQASSPEMDYQLPPHQQSQFTRQPIGPPIHHGQGLTNQQHHQYQNQHGQQSQQNQQNQQGQSGHQHHGNMMSAASQHHPTYSLVSSRMGHGPMQGHHIFRSVGPQGPPVHSNHGSHQGQQQQQHHQMMSAASNQNNPTYAFAPQGFRHYQGYPEGLQGHQQQQGVPQGPPLPQQQGHHQVPPQHMNGGQGPARDYNAAESYGRPAPYINRDSYVAQESAPLLEFQASQLPHEEESGGYQESNPAKGLTLHFGGGPVGGGGQVMTSPLGIFKSLLLPLLPKPRVNLNGKVVFGVVLEKGVGYGKQKHHPPPPPPHHAFHHFGKRR